MSKERQGLKVIEEKKAREIPNLLNAIAKKITISLNKIGCGKLKLSNEDKAHDVIVCYLA